MALLSRCGWSLCDLRHHDTNGIPLVSSDWPVGRAQPYHVVAQVDQSPGGLHVLGVWVRGLHRPTALAALLVPVEHTALAEVGARVVRRGVGFELGLVD